MTITKLRSIISEEIEKAQSRTIAETGEGTAEPYDYRKTNSDPSYGSDFEWVTDSGIKYDMDIRYDDEEGMGRADLVFKIDFSVKPSSAPKPEVGPWQTTNKGELYRVMATVVSIVKDEIREVGMPEEIIWQGHDPKRNQLFVQYIKKAFPEVEISTDEPYVHAKINEAARLQRIAGINKKD